MLFVGDAPSRVSVSEANDDIDMVVVRETFDFVISFVGDTRWQDHVGDSVLPEWVTDVVNASVFVSVELPDVVGDSENEGVKEAVPLVLLCVVVGLKE